jgi:xyloglucan-specific exo-beta-1,4-glucanase
MARSVTSKRLPTQTSMWKRALLAGLATGTFALGTVGLADRAAAESSTWRNVPIVAGGLITGIVFSPTEPGLAYVRTDIGGAYRWNEAAQRWVPLLDFVGFDEANLTGVESVATDPLDPDRLYVVAGTYTNEWMTENGEIFRSDDRGATFQRFPLPFKTGGNMPGRTMGERLVIDPNLTSTLFLGTRSGNGLWRSTDSGESFQKVESFPATGTYIENQNSTYFADPIGVVWIAFDPRTGKRGEASQTIYVGVADKAESVFRSVDGGTTWEALPGQPTGFLPHHAVLTPSNGQLYIVYSDGAGPFDGVKGDVWKFDTQTDVWTRISPIPSTSDDNYFGYGGLAVDAKNPNTLMLTSLNSYFPDMMIFRSTDGGANWSPIYEFTAFPDRLLRYEQDISASPWLTFGDPPVPPTPSPKLGFVTGTIAIDPFNSDRMLYGTGATVFGSDNVTAWDRGEKVRIRVMAEGIEETAVQDLISPPQGAPLLSAIGDIGGFKHDDITKVPPLMMVTPRFTTGTSLDYAELAPNVIMRVGTGDKGHFGFSLDGGTTSSPGGEPAGSTGGGVIAVAADGARAVWSPQGTGVNVSADRGTTWTPSAGVPRGAHVASDRVNPMTFYGFAGGKFFRSTDGGATFTASEAANLPGNARVKALPGREGDVWLASPQQGLFHSTDGGATFTRLANVEEADSIGFGKAAPGRTEMALFSSAQVDGVRGIFQSDDGGATWRRINDAQNQFGFTGMAITGDPRVHGRVYVTTNGRGIIVGEPQP